MTGRGSAVLARRKSSRGTARTEHDEDVENRGLDTTKAVQGGGTPLKSIASPSTGVQPDKKDESVLKSAIRSPLKSQTSKEAASPSTSSLDKVFNQNTMHEKDHNMRSDTANMQPMTKQRGKEGDKQQRRVLAELGWAEIQQRSAVIPPPGSGSSQHAIVQSAPTALMSPAEEGPSLATSSAIPEAPHSSHVRRSRPSRQATTLSGSSLESENTSNHSEKGIAIADNLLQPRRRSKRIATRNAMTDIVIPRAAPSSQQQSRKIPKIHSIR